MTARDFAYWLQGFFEISDTDDVKPEQVRMIKAHLALVLTKVTPTMEELKGEPKVDSPPWQPARKVIDPMPYPFKDERVICSSVGGPPGLKLTKAGTLPIGEVASAYGEALANKTLADLHTQLKTPIGKYDVDPGIKCQLTC